MLETVDKPQLRPCWEVADANVARYKQELDRALAANRPAKAELCRQLIDKWLDYRLEHGPDDKAAI